jgi:dienelactone hydrolase
MSHYHPHCVAAGSLLACGSIFHEAGECIDMADFAKVKAAADWPKARTEIEENVCSVLGAIPKERADLQVKTLDESQFNGYVRRRVNYFVDEWTRVSAWLFLPEGRDEVPAVLCCHSEVPQGKDEAAGTIGDPLLAFAHHYAELGYVTLAPDAVTFGERIPTGLAPGDSRNFYKDNPKMSCAAKMLVDHIHGIDLLGDIKRVDPARLGVVGHGLGAFNALLLTAFDERVQTCVASCGFTRFEDDTDPERWCRDSGLCLMPKFKDAVKKRKYPFDWEDILALAAPSYTLLLTAKNDEALPATESCAEAVKKARRIYKILGAPDALKATVHNEGHVVTPDLLDEADHWFERFM